MRVALIFRSKERNEYSIEALFESLRKYLENDNRIDYHYLPKGRYNRLSNILKNYQAANKIRADVFHITGEVNFIATALPKEKTIITVHDFVDLEKFKGVKWCLRYLFWYYIPFRHCRYIACISQKVCDELVERFPFTRDKVIYVPNPIDDAYIAEEKEFAASPIILIVGTRDNKNLERIIEAVRGINCELYIIGVLNKFQEELLIKYETKYTNVFHISDEEMRQAYCNCDIVCFPSLYEGFGRPIIEANAIGRPVVTSDLEPMPEVGADAAIYVDPYSVESIRNGIIKVMQDKDLREQIISAGYKNASKYRADIVAEKYLEVYKKVNK